MNRTDWIVVGAGTAGCTIASQLAQRNYPGGKLPSSAHDGLDDRPRRFDTNRVTLIEPASHEAPVTDRLRPARWLNLLGSSDDWNMAAEKCEKLAGRSLRWPRGRGLGGSSRINAMIWFPPTAADLQMLTEASGGQWNDQTLDLAFKRVLALAQPELPRWLSKASRLFMSAIDREHGVPMIYERLNRDGRRWTPARLLDEGRRNGAIQICRAMVDRLVWKGDRIIGVEVLSENSREILYANHGVVLSAGSIATPSILMRSGIGPRDELSKNNIDIRRESSSVGMHLQDHLIMPIVFKTKSGRYASEASPRDLARWQTIGTGPIASNLAECGGLFQKQSIQLHVTPTHYLTYPKPSTDSFMTIGVNLTQPQSTGLIRMRSADPLDAVKIHANYLENKNDRSRTIQAVHFARDLANNTGLSEWIESEALPGSHRCDNRALGKAIARYAQTLYHPVGTCRMGIDADSVVEPDFSVRDVEQLWIADASTLPRLTLGNPNATVMLLGFLAADQLMQIN